jgi:hypothetical protein
MPIISLTSQSPLGTETYLWTCAPLTVANATATPTPPTLPWSHSTVFVTPYETSNVLESGRVADLTTVHTPDLSCVDRWLFEPSMSCPQDSTAGGNTFWSVNPSRSTVSDALYSRCQLYGTATYSPGICPSGQTVAEVTAYASSMLNGTKTFWQASCCKRSEIVACLSF